MIKEAIVKIVNKEDLTYDEAYTVMNEIMGGETTATQNAAFLAALSTKSARAETTDEIAGAALDVLCREPMDPENPLLKIQDSTRLLITPHIAWAAKETRFRVVEEVVQNIRRFQRGDTVNRVY